MSNNANEKLVKDAFRACREGNTAKLREIFAYDNEVRIDGAAICPDPYPLLHDHGFYYRDVEQQDDDTVRSTIEYRRGSETYRGTLVDRIENVRGSKKIVSSTVVWEPETTPFGGASYDASSEYVGTYGWWGWPFGRRRS